MEVQLNLGAIQVFSISNSTVSYENSPAEDLLKKSATFFCFESRFISIFGVDAQVRKIMEEDLAEAKLKKEKQDETRKELLEFAERQVLRQ